VLRVVCTDQSLVKGPGYLVDQELYCIGRSSRCEFMLSDLSVSRFHAELTAADDRVIVKDLKSRNGTFLDGIRVEEAEIRPGQTICFGIATFQLVDHEKPNADPLVDNSNISTFIVRGAPAPSSIAVRQLSDAQRRVLGHLLTGLSEKEVACKLEISPHTVHNHVKEIYRKMSVNSRPELLALFVAGPKLAK
jgi:DNA-binding CsgD family transcriptional regulator